MTTNTRRKFLQSTATTGIAAATLAAFPPSIRRALAIPAHHDTGTVKDVKHVVLLMQENRSFDSYFGTFKGVRGFGDRFAVPTPNGKNVFHQTYTKTTPPSTYVPYHLDETKGNAQRAGSTPHSWSDSQAAWDHGRMYKWPDCEEPAVDGLLRHGGSAVPARAGRRLHAVRPLPLRHAHRHHREPRCSTGAAPTARTASARSTAARCRSRR